MKVSKDGLLIKRRLPFHSSESALKRMKEATVYVDKATDSNALARLFAPFKPKDIRIKDQYASVELESPA